MGLVLCGIILDCVKQKQVVKKIPALIIYVQHQSIVG